MKQAVRVVVVKRLIFFDCNRSETKTFRRDKIGPTPLVKINYYLALLD